MSQKLHSNNFRVLLVDDAQNIVEVFQSILESHGYTVYGYDSATEALAFYEVHYKKIELVLTDINMSEMSGVELARKIRKISPNQVIFGVSAFFNIDDTKREFATLFDTLNSKAVPNG